MFQVLEESVPLVKTKYLLVFGIVCSCSNGEYLACGMPEGCICGVSFELLVGCHLHSSGVFVTMSIDNVDEGFRHMRTVAR